MKKMDNNEGMLCLPKIWTIILAEDKDLFVGPFTGRKQRYRCYFKKIKSPVERLVVYFHLGAEEESEDPSPLPESIYLYGAYNQMTVCQMRSSGKIRKMKARERREFMTVMRKRFASPEKDESLNLQPSADEKRDALRLLKSGTFYRFDPVDYAFDTYDRG